MLIEDFQENYLTGWIKLYRSLMNKAFYKNDSEKVHLWIHLLFKANHKGYEGILIGKPITILTGQFLTGRMQLSRETGISESKIERILTNFEKIEQQIEQLKTPSNRLISIINYKQYQQSEQPFEQPLNNHRTTTEQPPNTNNNNKNNKKEKNIDFCPDNFKEKFKEWLQYKFERKESYKSNLSLEKCYNHLIKLSNNNFENASKIIDQSIANNWAGLFELKNIKNNKEYHLPEPPKLT